MATGGPGSNPYAANRHADVLGEEPTDDAAKMRLLEEVKNRAKGAFQQKDMPSAELLYGKAISILDCMPGSKKEATLYSNRAMVRLNLAKVEGALEDANKCLALDPTFPKGWHRKAQALLRQNEWDDAMAAAEEGRKLEPGNKAFGELIEKAQADKVKDITDKQRLKRDAQDVKVELHNASTARAPPKPKSADDANSMRGYKTTSDGKTTSYFHTEITEEAKRLIAEQGYGTPKKIERSAEDTDVKGGGSQWNQAGTYEEKGMMNWIKDSLKALVGIEFPIPTGSGGVIKTTGVDAITGDASISCSRGKRRHLMDVSFEVEFEATLGDQTGKGKIQYSEVSCGEDQPEVKVDVDGSTSPVVQEVFQAFVKSAGQGLQPLVTKALTKIIDEYKEK